MDLKVRFRITVHRLFGLPASSGPFVLKYCRGRKHRGETAPQKSDSKGQLLLDCAFEVDGTLQGRGGNKYRVKWLQFAVEEVRSGHRYSFGHARLDLAECVPFGHPNVRQLAFGLCSGDLVVRGALASGAVQPPDDMPLASTLLKQLQEAQHQLHEQEALLDALQTNGMLTPANSTMEKEEPNGKGMPGKAMRHLLVKRPELPKRSVEPSAARIEQLEAALQARTQECSNLRACVLTLEEKVNGMVRPSAPQLPVELRTGSARRCSGLEQALAAVNQKCRGLADVLDVQQQTIAALEQQLQAATHQRCSLEASLQRLQRDTTEVTLSHRCTENLIAQLQQATDARATAEAQARVAREALAAQQGRCAALEAEGRTLRQLLEDAGQATQVVLDLQVQLQDQAAMCCRLEAEGAAVRSAAEAAKSAHLEALQSIQALQTKLMALQQELDDARGSAQREAAVPSSVEPAGRSSLATLWVQLQAKDEEIQRLQLENAKLVANFSPDRRPSSRTPPLRFENVFRSDSAPSSPLLSPRSPEPQSPRS